MQVIAGCLRGLNGFLVQFKEEASDSECSNVQYPPTPPPQYGDSSLIVVASSLFQDIYKFAVMAVDAEVQPDLSIQVGVSVLQIVLG